LLFVKGPTDRARDRHADHRSRWRGSFEAIRELLAHHIGPIAKVYLQREAAEARTTEISANALPPKLAHQQIARNF